MITAIGKPAGVRSSHGVRGSSSDWAPYRDGYWYDDQPLGLTWVSNEAMGLDAISLRPMG